MKKLFFITLIMLVQGCEQPTTEEESLAPSPLLEAVTEEEPPMAPYGINGCTRQASVNYYEDSDFSGSWSETVDQYGSITSCDLSSLSQSEWSFIESYYFGVYEACAGSIETTYDENGQTVRYERNGQSIRFDIVSTGHFRFDGGYFFGQIDVFIERVDETQIKMRYFSSTHAQNSSFDQFLGDQLICEGETTTPDLCVKYIKFYNGRVSEIKGDGLCVDFPSNNVAEDFCSHRSLDADGIEDWVINYYGYNCN